MLEDPCSSRYDRLGFYGSKCGESIFSAIIPSYNNMQPGKSQSVLRFLRGRHFHSNSRDSARETLDYIIIIIIDDRRWCWKGTNRWQSLKSYPKEREEN